MNRTTGLLFALLFLFQISCKRYSNEKKEYNKDGSIAKRTVFYNSVNKNLYREYKYFENQSIQSIVEYNNAVPDGRCFNYYANGVIQSVYYYNNGRINGIGRYYDESGRLTDKGLFISDSMVVKEEFFYRDDIIKVNVFSTISGEMKEAGSLLYKTSGLFGLDNSFYFTCNSVDSIPLHDSIQVNVNFMGRADKSYLSLLLGNLDRDLVFTSRDRTLLSDTLSLSFYYRPKEIGYNLITGKLLLVNPTEKQTREYVFYHDFLAY